LRTVRPSPARAAAPEPAAWLSLTDLGEVLDLEVQLWADEIDLTSSDSPSIASSGTTGNVTLVAVPIWPEAPPAPELEPYRVRRSGVVALVPPWDKADAVPAPAPAPAAAPTRTTPLTRPQAPARPTLVQAVVLTATAAAVAVGALMLTGAKQHEVTIELDGRSAIRATDARTVGDLLREQHVALGPLDRVVPGLAARVADGVVIRVERNAARPSAGKTAVAPVAVVSPPVAEPPAVMLPPAQLPLAAPAPPPAQPVSSRPSATGTSKEVTRRPAPVVARPVNGSADGGASWYASPFGSDSCASRTLKMGTIVIITNVQTGATTTCRVADRGPMAYSRVLDLDNDVFRRLAPLGIGVIPVHITW
jgi:hypothetical protein